MDEKSKFLQNEGLVIVDDIHDFVNDYARETIKEKSRISGTLFKWMYKSFKSDLDNVAFVDCKNHIEISFNDAIALMKSYQAYENASASEVLNAVKVIAGEVCQKLGANCPDIYGMCGQMGEQGWSRNVGEKEFPNTESVRIKKRKEKGFAIISLFDVFFPLGESQEQYVKRPAKNILRATFHEMFHQYISDYEKGKLLHDHAVGLDGKEVKLNNALQKKFSLHNTEELDCETFAFNCLEAFGIPLGELEKKKRQVQRLSGKKRDGKETILE